MMPGADRHHDGVPHTERRPFVADLDDPATPFDREHVDMVVAVSWERTSRWQLRPEESDLARAGAAKLVIVLPLDSWVGWSSARSIDMDRLLRRGCGASSHCRPARACV